MPEKILNDHGVLVVLELVALELVVLELVVLELVELVVLEVVVLVLVVLVVVVAVVSVLVAAGADGADGAGVFAGVWRSPATAVGRRRRLERFCWLPHHAAQMRS